MWTAIMMQSKAASPSSDPSLLLLLPLLHPRLARRLVPQPGGELALLAPQ